MGEPVVDIIVGGAIIVAVLVVTVVIVWRAPDPEPPPTYRPRPTRWVPADRPPHVPAPRPPRDAWSGDPDRTTRKGAA